MGAKLYIQPAQANPFEISIGNTATIGRTRENTVCLDFSPLVSRQHAIIRCHDGHHFQLIDLGSRNGTFVNEQRVIMPVVLEIGARIRVGDTSLIFARDRGDDGQEHLQSTMMGTGSVNALAARPVALLVCDIRGFSAISEKTDSGELAYGLGAWFRETANLVARSGGTIDKFIGDAILAYWSSRQSGPLDGGAAFATARAMRALASGRTWPNGEPFRIAVALHYGLVTCSNVGIAAERDATIVGDAVNTVFRLESLAKELAQEIVVSGELAMHLPTMEGFVELGQHGLKGKAQTVLVFGRPISD